MIERACEQWHALFYSAERFLTGNFPAENLPLKRLCQVQEFPGRNGLFSDVGTAGYAQAGFEKMTGGYFSA